MKNFWIVPFLLVLLVACSQPSPQPYATVPEPQQPDTTPILPTAEDLSGTVILDGAQRVVDDLKSLCCEEGWMEHLSRAENEAYEEREGREEFDAGAAFLESLEASGERFDASQIFTVLTHLKPEDGYLLDYVYFAPGGFGAPYFYARREGEPPLADYAALESIGFEDYLGHIQLDSTAESYFEFAVLTIMGHQFYLSWHATYDDWQVVASQERLGEIIDQLNEDSPALTEEQQEAIFGLNTHPEVTIKRNTVQVELLVFSRWSGFFKRIYTIDRDFPHRMKEKEIELVPISSGAVL